MEGAQKIGIFVLGVAIILNIVAVVSAGWYTVSDVSFGLSSPESTGDEGYGAVRKTF